MNRLHAELVKVLGAPDVRQRLAAEGAEIVASGPAGLGSWLSSEIQLYSDLVHRLGLKVD